MKKEVLTAIIIGFGIGLLITFAVYCAQSQLKQSSQILSPIADKINSQPEAPLEIISSISLTSPIDESISKEAKIAVVGTTSPSSWVVVLTEKEEIVTQADSKGNFETEVFLISGENEIEVKSFDEQGKAVSKTVTVVYSTAEI